MTIFNKKKKEVPEELPDLISDEVEKNSQEVHEYLKENEKIENSPRKKESDVKEMVVSQKINSPDILPEEEVVKKTQIPGPKIAVERVINPSSNSSKEIVSRLVKSVENEETKKVEKKTPIMNEKHKDKSFFNELQNNLSYELNDPSNFEEWYKEKFSSRDILSDMKGYWEDKKEDSILESLGRNFQERINHKIEKLQGLEKVWQNIYFELIEKEEEIKENEAELKEIIQEFVQVCKRKKSSTEIKDEVEEEKIVGENKENEEKSEEKNSQ